MFLLRIKAQTEKSPDIQTRVTHSSVTDSGVYPAFQKFIIKNASVLKPTDIQHITGLG